MSVISNMQIFIAGSCKNLECLAFKGGAMKKVDFPALCVYFKVLIEDKEYNILFDSGYSKHFFNATKKMPEKLYALATPVRLEFSLKEQLSQKGIKKIDFIFISHFHADHIGGIKDFENAYFIASKNAYETFMKQGKFVNLKQGILPNLLPKNFQNRLVSIENLEKAYLNDEFKEVYKWLDCFFIVPLFGHALGQYGLFFEYKNQQIFLIADAVWDYKSIEFNALPSKLTHFILNNTKEFYHSLKLLQEMKKTNSKVFFIPSHCKKSIEKLSIFLKEVNV